MRLAAILLAACTLGCGRQELDLLVPAAEPDPCLPLSTRSACDERAALGCSFQPNPEGCRSDDPGCGPGTCSRGDAFVRRVERGFLLNGQSFRFAGVSSWGLLQPGACASVESDERERWLQAAFDDLVASRAKVARAFAFQGSAGASGTDFAFLDAAVTQARRAGVRLLLILEHADGGCSEGGPRNSAWYTTGYLNPDGGYAIAYRDYARALAERYRDEPTVLGYVLAQSLGAGVAATALTGFVNDMGQLLHGVAPNQLVSLDLNWQPRADSEVAEYRALQSLPVVDFVDIDDYVFEESPGPLDPALLEVLSDIDKPVIVGEGAFGLEADDVEALTARAERARNRLQSWHEAGFAGALLWAYQPGWREVSEEFDARPSDPLLQPGGVLARAPF